jgi:hypothetical protein
MPVGKFILRQHRTDETFADAALGLQDEMYLSHYMMSSFLGDELMVNPTLTGGFGLSGLSGIPGLSGKSLAASTSRIYLFT